MNDSIASSNIPIFFSIEIALLMMLKILINLSTKLNKPPFFLICNVPTN